MSQVAIVRVLYRNKLATDKDSSYQKHGEANSALPAYLISHFSNQEVHILKHGAINVNNWFSGRV